jgi:hypothetical protein
MKPGNAAWTGPLLNLAAAPSTKAPTKTWHDPDTWLIADSCAPGDAGTLHTPPGQCAASSFVTATSQSEVRVEESNAPQAGLPKDTLPRLTVDGAAAADAMVVKRPAANTTTCVDCLALGILIVVELV